MGSLLSPPGSPISNSLVKGEMQIDFSGDNLEVSQLYYLSPILTLQGFPSRLHSLIPTMGQPVIGTALKEMLISLRSSLKTDIISIMHKFGHSISVLEDRVSHIEANMGNITATVNDIIDGHEDQVRDTKWIKDKLADTEDRSHWKNNKIHSIPESVQPSELSSYARGMIKALLPDLKNIKLVIDRIQRLPKLSFLPKNST